MTKEELDKILTMARGVKDNALKPGAMTDDKDVAYLLMDSFVGGSFDAGVLMACYELKTYWDRKAVRYGATEQHLHSAHNKIKRQQRALKRKARDIECMNAEIVRTNSNYFKLCNERDKEKMRTNNLTWLAEHMEQAIEIGIKEKEADLKFHYDMLAAEKCQEAHKVQKKITQCLNGINSYLVDMCEYLKQDDTDIKQCRQSINEAMVNIKDMQQGLDKLLQSFTE